MKRFVVVVLGAGALLAPAAVASGGRTVNTFGKDRAGCRMTMTVSIHQPARRVAPCHPENSVFYVQVRGGTLFRGDLLQEGRVARLYGRGVLARGVQRGRDWRITVVTASARPIRVAVRLKPF